MAPLMAGQMPVVCLLAAVGLATSCNPLRWEIPMESGIRPDPSTPPFPVLFLNSRPLPPAVRLWWFIAAPIISTIPIHLLRCTTITPAATTTDLLPVSSASRYCHLVPSGHGGLCASSALGLAKPFCSHPDPSLPLTSCCSKLSSWRSRMGDGQAVGQLLFQPG